ncbi:hypothetical protein DXN05_01280 [Deminuibacter soli]|uniref:Uncharacterized protein n=1 Tax=Deminuibacter soli TaxID=2291815 RepID=A0A3E1NNY8_9BACT|nr:hypothetical protein DXN05_01280 [Deminuibacter soli]
MQNPGCENRDFLLSQKKCNAPSKGSGNWFLIFGVMPTFKGLSDIGFENGGWKSYFLQLK